MRKQVLPRKIKQSREYGRIEGIFATFYYEKVGFLQHFTMKNFKDTMRFQEFYSDHPHSQ